MVRKLENDMASYKTKQRTLLLDFLSSHPHDTFSAFEIYSMFSEEISKSAVYRNLADLESAGEIKKVSKSGSREVFYRYAHAKACENHIHIFCKVCKNAVHLNKNISKALAISLKQTDGFALDMSDTIIYGICKNCENQI